MNEVDPKFYRTHGFERDQFLEEAILSAFDEIGKHLLLSDILWHVFDVYQAAGIQRPHDRQIRITLWTDLIGTDGEDKPLMLDGGEITRVARDQYNQ